MYYFHDLFLQSAVTIRCFRKLHVFILNKIFWKYEMQNCCKEKVSCQSMLISCSFIFMFKKSSEIWQTLYCFRKLGAYLRTSNCLKTYYLYKQNHLLSISCNNQLFFVNLLKKWKLNANRSQKEMSSKHSSVICYNQLFLQPTVTISWSFIWKAWETTQLSTTKETFQLWTLSIFPLKSVVKVRYNHLFLQPAVSMK